MNIDKNLTDDHQVKLSVEIEQEQLDIAKRKAARKIAKKTKIPGFRPGKAPFGVIQKYVGEGRILDDALDILINDVYPDIISEAEIEPYGPGSLENVVSLDPPKFEFLVPLKASVVLGDYKEVSIDYQEPSVSEQDVQETLDRLLDQQASIEEVERESEVGDIVQYQISGKEVKPPEDREPYVLEERDSTTVIKEDKDPSEWPFPGFSKKLLGAPAGKSKRTTFTYPEDYKDEDLAGLKVQYKVNVTKVQGRIRPEFDDEFAKSISQFETVEELKVDAGEKLAIESKAAYAAEYDEMVLEEIINNSEIKFPPQMLDHEKNDLRMDMENRLAQQGISMDIYLQIRGLSEEQLEEELLPVAEKRLKQSLVLFEIASEEDLKVDPGKIEEEATRTFNAYASSLPPKEARKLKSENVLPSIYTNLMVDALARTSMDWLRSSAKGELEEPEDVEEETDTQPEQSVENEDTEE